MKNQTVSLLFEKYEKLFYQSDDWKERGKTKEEKMYLICSVYNLLNNLLYVHQYGEKAQEQKGQEVQKLRAWTSSIKGVNHLAQKIATELENATFAIYEKSKE